MYIYIYDTDDMVTVNRHYTQTLVQWETELDVDPSSLDQAQSSLESPKIRSSVCLMKLESNAQDPNYTLCTQLE